MIKKLISLCALVALSGTSCWGAAGDTNQEEKFDPWKEWLPELPGTIGSEITDYVTQAQQKMYEIVIKDVSRKTFRVPVAKTDTIADVKKKLAQKYNIPLCQLGKLTIRRREFEDDTKMERFDPETLGDNSVIILYRMCQNPGTGTCPSGTSCPYYDPQTR